MAYRDDITALGADHLWRLDGALTDDVGAVTLTNTGMLTNTGAICEDATNSVSSNGTTDRLVATTATDIDGALSVKIVAGWVRLNSVQLPPRSIYREGTTGNQFNFVLWAGNALMLDIVDTAGPTVLQAYSDNVLQPNRTYHICGVMAGDASGDSFALFIDGVLQQVKNPTSGLVGFTTLGARTAAEWADPSGSTEVGNQTVLINGSTDCAYNFWCTFTTSLSATQIREELFEKGAIPEQTITSDTQANMQTQLDALASSQLSDSPLSIRVEAPV